MLDEFLGNKKENESEVFSASFNSDEFTKGISEVIKSIDRLRESVGGRETMQAFAKAEQASSDFYDSFSLKSSMAFFASQKILDAIFSIASAIKSITFDNMSAGFDKYQQKISAVQTMVAATGRSVDEVNYRMEKLAQFTDETSYNFADMAQYASMFTNVGVDLDTAVASMEGIASWAASAGANAEQASRAMYNLSQAMGFGYIQLVDWKSIEYAGMGTEKIKNQIMEMAAEMGTLRKASDGVYMTLKGSKVTSKNFASTLSDKWFTSNVLVNMLNEYNKFFTQIQKVSMETGMTITHILSELEKDGDGYSKNAIAFAEKYGIELGTVGEEAFRAAQQTKSFTEAINATMDAVSSGWMKSFDYIFGNRDEAIEFWSEVTEILYDVFAASAELRNLMLKYWHEMEGREELLGLMEAGWNQIKTAVNAARIAFRQIFPYLTPDNIDAFIEKTRDLKDKLLKPMVNVFARIYAFTHVTLRIIKDIFEIFSKVPSMLKPIFDLGKKIVDVLIEAAFRGLLWIAETLESIMDSDASKTFFKIVGDLILGIVNMAATGIINIFSLISMLLPYIISGLNTMLNIFGKIASFTNAVLGLFVSIFKYLEASGTLEKIKNILIKIGSIASIIFDNLLNVITSITEGIDKATASIHGIKFDNKNKNGDKAATEASKNTKVVSEANKTINKDVNSTYTIFSTFFSNLAEFVGNLVKSASLHIIKFINTGLTYANDFVVEKLPEITHNIVGSIISMFENIGDTITSYSALELLKIKSVFEFAVDMFKGINAVFTGMEINKFIKAGRKFIKAHTSDTLMGMVRTITALIATILVAMTALSIMNNINHDAVKKSLAQLIIILVAFIGLSGAMIGIAASYKAISNKPGKSLIPFLGAIAAIIILISGQVFKIYNILKEDNTATWAGAVVQWVIMAGVIIVTLLVGMLALQGLIKEIKVGAGIIIALGVSMAIFMAAIRLFGLKLTEWNKDLGILENLSTFMQEITGYMVSLFVPALAMAVALSGLSGITLASAGAAMLLAGAFALFGIAMILIRVSLLKVEGSSFGTAVLIGAVMAGILGIMKAFTKLSETYKTSIPGMFKMAGSTMLMAGAMMAVALSFVIMSAAFKSIIKAINKYDPNANYEVPVAIGILIVLAGLLLGMVYALKAINKNLVNVPVINNTGITILIESLLAISVMSHIFKSVIKTINKYDPNANYAAPVAIGIILTLSVIVLGLTFAMSKLYNYFAASEDILGGTNFRSIGAFAVMLFSGVIAISMLASTLNGIIKTMAKTEVPVEKFWVAYGLVAAIAGLLVVFTSLIVGISYIIQKKITSSEYGIVGLIAEIATIAMIFSMFTISVLVFTGEIKALTRMLSERGENTMILAAIMIGAIMLEIGLLMTVFGLLFKSDKFKSEIAMKIVGVSLSLLLISMAIKNFGDAIGRLSESFKDDTYKSALLGFIGIVASLIILVIAVFKIINKWGKLKVAGLEGLKVKFGKILGAVAIVFAAVWALEFILGRMVKLVHNYEWNEVLTAFEMIAVMLVAVYGLLMAMNKVVETIAKASDIGTGKLFSISSGIAIMAAGIVLVAISLMLLRNVKLDDSVVAALGIVLGAMTLLSLILTLLNKRVKSSSGMTAMDLGAMVTFFVGFIASLFLIASALKKLNGIDLTGAGKAIKELSPLLIGLVALAAVAAIAAGSGMGWASLLTGTFVVLGLAGAVWVLADAVKNLGKSTDSFDVEKYGKIINPDENVNDTKNEVDNKNKEIQNKDQNKENQNGSPHHSKPSKASVSKGGGGGLIHGQAGGITVNGQRVMVSAITSAAETFSNATDELDEAGREWAQVWNDIQTNDLYITSSSLYRNISDENKKIIDSYRDYVHEMGTNPETRYALATIAPESVRDIVNAAQQAGHRPSMSAPDAVQVLVTGSPHPIGDLTDAITGGAWSEATNGGEEDLSTNFLEASIENGTRLLGQNLGKEIGKVPDLINKWFGGNGEGGFLSSILLAIQGAADGKGLSDLGGIFDSFLKNSKVDQYVEENLYRPQRKKVIDSQIAKYLVDKNGKEKYPGLKVSARWAPATYDENGEELTPGKWVLDYDRNIKVAAEDLTKFGQIINDVQKMGGNELIESRVHDMYESVTEEYNKRMEDMQQKFDELFKSMDPEKSGSETAYVYSMSDAVKDVTKKLKQMNPALAKSGKLSAAASGAVNNLAYSLALAEVKANNSFESYKDENEAIKNLTEQYKQSFSELYTTIRSNTLSAYSDNPFEKFNKKAAMSKGRMLRNLRKRSENIEQYVKWMNQIRSTASPQLYGWLLEQDPETAYGYLKSIMKMDSSEMSELNGYFRNIQSKTDSIASDLISDYALTGVNVSEGFAGGIDTEAGLSKMKELGTKSLDELKKTLKINSPSKATEEIGMWTCMGLINGISNYSGLVENAATNLGTLLLQGLNTNFDYNTLYKKGQDIATGFSQGILDIITGKTFNSTIQPMYNSDSNYAYQLNVPSTITTSCSNDVAVISRNMETMISNQNTIINKMESIQTSIDKLGSMTFNAYMDPSKAASELGPHINIWMGRQALRTRRGN
ncbi:tape measure protein [Segatella bryantii]|uniref:tape measure protein n=1 Tax=Segatella bryantii TaxID=77095 RepID=UPI00242AF43B|nr:tape measure protein [Segatella bryantii]